MELNSGTRAGTDGSRDAPGKIVNKVLAVEWPHGTGSLRVVGEVDLTTRDIWREALTAVLDHDTHVRLDLSALSFVDVQGAAALAETARRLASTRRLTLYRPPLSLLRTLDLFWSGDLSAIVIEEAE